VTRAAAARVGSDGRVVGLDLNAAMLDVARTSVGGAASPVEWCEGSASEMPLPDAAFDVVLCQHGLQQFSDRPAALAEMRRVLRPDGRLAVAVWAEIEQSPGFAALVAGLGKHVGEAAANNRRAPFALSSAEELERLVREAGFQDVVVQTRSGMARFPTPEKFVEWQVAASPLATLGGLTDAAFTAVCQDVSAALRPYVGIDGCAFPMAAHLLTAHT
jgi:ubiquinone/menaquinone biosynthesis C-methylase UbiE